MARLFFGMNQSLDGYADHMGMRPPSPKLFRRFIEQTDGLAGSLYGRNLYGLMRYWDDDQPGWDAAHHEFAAAWRKAPKWVVSRTLDSVGPNARLVQGDLETEVRRLKTEIDGEASDLVASVDTSEDTPIYHPFLYGAQQDGRARAGFYGIGGWHGRAHMLRALFEGVVFEHARHIDVLRRAGPQISSATLSGGGSRSSVWPQIFADVLEVPVTVSRSRETGALGAAIAAGAGVGLFADYAAGTSSDDGARTPLCATVTAAPHYAARRDTFTQLAEAMTPIWANMGQP